LLYHLWNGSTAYLGLFEDDYFYYAIIADKLVDTGRLTYDGMTITNGFHPLWFLVVTALRFAFGRFTVAFYVAFTAIAVAAMITTYELAVRFARRLGAGPALAAAAPAMLAFPAARLLTTGLECVLAVPLYLWLLVEAAAPDPLTSRRAARLGIVASLAILARLDLALAVALLMAAVAYSARPAPGQLPRLVLNFCLGGVLLPCYALLNLYFVGSPFPVSALAKRLTTAPGLSLAYLRVAATDSVYGPAMAILLPLGAFAVAAAVARSRADERAAWLVAASATAFAAVFFLLNALTSWVFFGWYAYAMHAAALVSVIAVARLLAGARPGAVVAVCAVAIVCLAQPYLALRYYRTHGPAWAVSDNGMLKMSVQLADAMRGRDGLIAMGAVAGIATYVMDRPVLQVEGIVADLRMVRHVKAQDDLGEVLREYGADYLVVTLAAGAPMEVRDSCYVVTQPHQQWAGTRSAKMRGAICSPPITRFRTVGGANPWSIFPHMDTWVWDLRSATWRP
jgi:hypothetical protein